MNKWQVLGLGFTIVLLLGVLAAGLQTLEFRGGSSYTVPDLGEPVPSGELVLPLPYHLFEWLIQYMPWFILGITILAAVVFRRNFLREIARLRLLIVFMVILALLGVRPSWDHFFVATEDPSEVEQEFTDAAPGELLQPPLPAPEPGPGNAAPHSPAQLPWWVTYLAATALAVPLLWLAWRLVRRADRRHQTQASQNELREMAAQAAADLRAGASVEEVVIRCWARMAGILAARAGGDAPEMTPRELAALLAKSGMRHEAIAELTALFEEVRYGSKADAPRRERAIAALAAIEEAYGSA